MWSSWVIYIPTVSDKDIAPLQDDLLAATGDPSVAFDACTGGIQMMASTRNPGGGVKCVHSAA